MPRLFVHQIRIKRNYEEMPDYLIVEDGNLSHPLVLLSQFEAQRLRDALNNALAGKAETYGEENQ